MLYFFIPITKTINETIVIKHNPIGVNIVVMPTPKNFGIEPINKANVNNPKAIPLLLSNILLRAVNVIGIVILKNNIAKNPKNGLLKANIKQIEDTANDTIEILLNPILSAIIPPNIFPKTTANIEINANIKLLFHSNANINPT